MGSILINKNKGSQKAIKMVAPIVEKPTEIIKEVPVEIEKIVEVIKEIEVKVPEYITVIKEERIEVPIFHEVIREVEKIVEIPSVRVVEKPIYITKEIVNIDKLIKEKQQHNITRKVLNVSIGLLVVSVCLNLYVLLM